MYTDSTMFLYVVNRNFVYNEKNLQENYMETLSDLLERAKEKTGSDAATARALGVGANTLGNWKYGFGGPKDIQRAKLADMLGMSFENVSAIVNAEKAEGEEKTYWLKKLCTFATAAGVGAMSLVLVTLSAPNNAQASTNTESVYIM